MISFPTSGDIFIEVNGRRLAVAQSYRARTGRETKAVEAFGQSEPVGAVAGRAVHQLELSRVQLLGEGGDGVDFYALSDFNVVIAKPGRHVIYSGCQWASIDESAGLGGVVLESVSIVAARRMVLA